VFVELRSIFINKVMHQKLWKLNYYWCPRMTTNFFNRSLITDFSGYNC
jgi:hypothetical protein